MAEAFRAPLENLARHADHSWLQKLVPDPETEKYAPNKESRQVRSGHYVRVNPTPLPQPRLVIHSQKMAKALDISEDEVSSGAFVGFFSGDQKQVAQLESWCTPYALSIMGQQQYQNCPFGNGNGYGDGRAISVGEVVVDGRRWELQLKGGGTTPFCRGADGRAVLRSSIREFLASEAMHSLGVETTRALSLIVSEAETVKRPWYSGSGDVRGYGSDQPDVLITEACAITTRVAPSFLRIGHIDLFGRRVAAAKKKSGDASATARQQLEQIVTHAMFREYPEAMERPSLAEQATAMLEAAPARLGAMVAGWLRVGFCQGNFNCDNCLVAGRTMDYGPFGWMDMYDPFFAKWVGSGDHFAFLNQPRAAMANYCTLVESVAELLEGDTRKQVAAIVGRGVEVIAAITADVWRVKMGFSKKDSKVADDLWKELEPLMRQSQIDYTLFWRKLADVVRGGVDTGRDDESLLTPLREAFYEPKRCEKRKADWAKWLRRWLAALVAEEGGGDKMPRAIDRMLAANPKYIPREWMLVEAYGRASNGDYELVHELHQLFSRPYEEQPEFEAKYFCRAPDVALKKGGVAHMS
eukprot:TRINITY_DN19711_c0_g1_i1.p1 TRINITY_DN19711_c0_g1~~TRINITY_DN19711_c0_g1_i1.p1  ORF type:complete len:582 (-),score=109.03 TRINITY_DN19711_c0_g1_i1:204-1949(-)